jgi:hypothetical protein
MKKNHLPLLAALGCLAVSTAAQAQGYDYQSFDYPGQTCEFQTCIQVWGNNDQGKVVGTASVGLDAFSFVYDWRKGTFTNVVPVDGYADNSVIGINDRGDLVGSVSDAGIQRGLVLNADGSAIVFDHPDAVTGTSARGINNQGLVTGFNFTGPSFAQLNTGFIYDPSSGTFTDIVPSYLTIAQGINSRGEVVGSAFFGTLFGNDVADPCDTGEFAVRYGWVRRTDGEVIYFRVNGGLTAARAINDAGQIGGFVSGRGFVVELDGTQCQEIAIAQEDMVHFPGAEYTFVQGLTNAGVISGSYGDGSGTTNAEHGFIAAPQ